MGNSATVPRVHGWTVLTLTVLLFLTGCSQSSSARRFVGWEDTYAGGKYPRAVEQWTREGRIYRGLELELLGQATYKSKDLRKAYVEEFSRVYRLGQDQVSVLEREEAEAEQRVHEFMIATYVPDTQLDDFAGKSPSWKMYLLQDGASPISPESIKKTKADPTIRHFFPYVSPWKSMYTVRFPKTASPKEGASIRLIITGVRGNIEMEWLMDPPYKADR